MTGNVVAKIQKKKVSAPFFFQLSKYYIGFIVISSTVCRFIIGETNDDDAIANDVGFFFFLSDV